MTLEERETISLGLAKGRALREMAEVVNTLHIGRNTGETAVKLVVFHAGAAGQALTVKDEPRQPARN